MPSWLEFVAGRKAHKTGGEVAVHRPLLVLYVLGRAQAGGSNRFRFQELVDELKKALRHFGHSRKSFHAEYPFWYLENAEFWVIEEKHRSPLSPGRKEPTQGALFEADATAVVPAVKWEELKGNPTQVDHLVTLLLETYWPDQTMHRAI